MQLLVIPSRSADLGGAAWDNPLVDPGDEPPPPGARVASAGFGRVLVVRESHPGRWSYFGHVALELVQGLSYARLVDVPVVVVPPRGFSTHAFLEIDCDGVRIIRSRGARAALRLLSARGDWTAALRDAGEAVRKQAAQDVKSFLRGHELPKAVRGRLRETADRLDPKRPSETGPGTGPYWRRRLVATPVRTHLTPRAERRAAELAASVGIPPDKPIVTAHARARGYKLDSDGRGTQSGKAAYGGMDEATRNAWVETYFPAMDFLVEQGYTVVRFGDRTMTPVRRPGVVDVATSAVNDPLLDLYCLLRSRFVLCGESSPHSVSHLTNTPLLTVNATDPVGAYPPRRDGIILMKTVVDRETGGVLTLGDLLSEEYQTFKRHPGRYAYVQNTPEAILDAVQEMLELLDRNPPETAGQTHYRELLTRATDASGHVHYVAKFAPDRGFLGYGRLARSQADPWFAGLPASPASTPREAETV